MTRSSSVKDVKKKSVRAMATMINQMHEQMNIQPEWDSVKAQALVGLLQQKGWKNRKSHTANSKANYEAHLQKGSMRVDVIATFFMGVFTEISVWSA